MTPGGRDIAGVRIDVRVVADDLGYARVVHSLVEDPVCSLPDSIGDTYPIPLSVYNLTILKKSVI